MKRGTVLLLLNRMHGWGVLFAQMAEAKKKTGSKKKSKKELKQEKRTETGCGESIQRRTV